MHVSVSTITLIILLLSTLIVFIKRALKMTNVASLSLISALMVVFFEIMGVYSPFNFISYIEILNIEILKSIDFRSVVLDWMLGLLLFAFATKVDVSLLKKWKYQTITLATAGVVISAIFISIILYSLSFILLPNGLPFIYCLLFGTLISPTDPVAAIGVLKNVKVNKDLEIKLVGESLFNDGVGIVLFLTVLDIASGQSMDFATAIILIPKLLIIEILGACIFGFMVGIFATQLLKRCGEDFILIILLTLSTALGSYIIGHVIHVSGPIAVVMSGLVIARRKSQILTEDQLFLFDNFWHAIDEILNVILFVLLGFEVLLVSFSPKLIMLCLLAFISVVLGRYFGVVLSLLPYKNKVQKGTIPILTWGGIRGGISLALAISLLNESSTLDANSFFYRSVIIGITFGVVILSGTIQGSTLQKIITVYYRPEPTKDEKEQIKETQFTFINKLFYRLLLACDIGFKWKKTEDKFKEALSSKQEDIVNTSASNAVAENIDTTEMQNQEQLQTQESEQTDILINTNDLTTTEEITTDKVKPTFMHKVARLLPFMTKKHQKTDVSSDINIDTDTANNNITTEEQFASVNNVTQEQKDDSNIQVSAEPQVVNDEKLDTIAPEIKDIVQDTESTTENEDDIEVSPQVVESELEKTENEQQKELEAAKKEEEKIIKKALEAEIQAEIKEIKLEDIPEHLAVTTAETENEEETPEDDAF